MISDPIAIKKSKNFIDGKKEFRAEQLSSLDDIFTCIQIEGNESIIDRKSF